jgi:hypothetical protein
MSLGQTSYEFSLRGFMKNDLFLTYTNVRGKGYIHVFSSVELLSRFYKRFCKELKTVIPHSQLTRSKLAESKNTLSTKICPKET